MSQPLFDFEHLTVDQRVELAEQLWESVVASPQDLSLTPAQERELDRRVAAYHEDGDPGQPWEDALREIETSRP